MPVPPDEGARVKTLASRLVEGIVWDGGCARWTRGHDHKGYGTIHVPDRGKRMVHRVVFELQNGPIPAGLAVDHKCFTRDCINPEHLQLATPAENMENRQGARRDSSSGVRGVSWDSSRGKWYTSARKDGRTYSAGRYAMLEDAERAAIALRNQLFTNNLVDRGLAIE